MSVTAESRSAVVWVGVEHVALVIAMAGAVLAINQAIDGAATDSEKAVVLWGTVAAAVGCTAALAGFIRTRRLVSAVDTPQDLRTARRRFAVGLVAAASCFGLIAAGERFAALVDHIGARTDDPTTDLTLGLQVLMAVILAGAAVVIGLRELRRR